MVQPRYLGRAAGVTHCCTYELKAYDCAFGAFENTELQEGKEGVESQMESYGFLSWSVALSLEPSSSTIASTTPNNASAKLDDTTRFLQYGPEF